MILLQNIVATVKGVAEKQHFSSKDKTNMFFSVSVTLNFVAIFFKHTHVFNCLNSEQVCVECDIV